MIQEFIIDLDTVLSRVESGDRNHTIVWKQKVYYKEVG